MARASKSRRIAAARYSRREGGVAKPEMEINKWLDLPRDCLSRILFLLNPVEAILVVPLVCKYWGRIFFEHFFWKQGNGCLDLTPLDKEPFYSFFCRSGDENSRATKVMNLLVGVMHSFASDGHGDADDNAFMVTPILDISFPFHLPLYDRHIVYVAERSPELRSLSIPWAMNLTGRGISRAMRYWSKMEQIVYGSFGGPLKTRVVEEFGISCKNLRYLTLYAFDFQWQSSALLASSLKSLKILVLEGANISKYGLQIYLSRCKKLEMLYIRHCVSDTGGVFINCGKSFVISSHQEGRRTRWSTDLYPDKVGETYTPKELVNLIWQPKR